MSVDQNAEDVRYVARPYVVEERDGEVWVGALPSGPIVRLDGTGLLVLELLAEEDQSAAEIAEELRNLMTGVSEGEALESEVREFISELTRLCLVST